MLKKALVLLLSDATFDVWKVVQDGAGYKYEQVKLIS